MGDGAHHHGEISAALHALAHSKDPRVAAKARELLEMMEHAHRKHDGDRKHDEKHGARKHDEKHGDRKHDEKHGDRKHEEKHGDRKHEEKHGDRKHEEKHQFHFQIVPVKGKQGKWIELKLEGQGKKTEKRITVVGGLPKNAKGAQLGGILELQLGKNFEQKGGKGHKGVVVITAVGKGGAGLAPRGASSLKLSADGKTAAVLGADGSITVFDVASGKELMKFGGKK